MRVTSAGLRLKTAILAPIHGPKIWRSTSAGASKTQEPIDVRDAAPLRVKHDIIGALKGYDPGAPALVGAGHHHNGAAFPPPDLDEAAGFIGRIRGLGPILGRAVMLGGGLYALHAAIEAWHAIGDDASARTSAQGHLLNLAAVNGADHIEVGARTQPIKHRLQHAEVNTRTFGLVSQTLLLLGSAGMALNLLCAAEIFGYFLPVLVPISNAAMPIAVVFMLLYGGLVAIKAAYDFVKTHAVTAADAESTDTPHFSLARRNAVARAYDASLGVTGFLQAFGAYAQWAFGPIWLAPLLLGTIGLGITKVMQARQQGHVKSEQLTPDAPLSSAPKRDVLMLLQQVAHEQHAFLHVAQPSVLRRWAHRVYARMQALRQGSPTTEPQVPDAKTRARQALKTFFAARKDVSAQTAQQLGFAPTLFGDDANALFLRFACAQSSPRVAINDLMDGMSSIGMFEAFAWSWLSDPSLPRPSSWREDGLDYRVGPRELMSGYVQTPHNDAEQQQTMERLHTAACSILSRDAVFGVRCAEATLVQRLWAEV